MNDTPRKTSLSAWPGLVCYPGYEGNSCASSCISTKGFDTEFTEAQRQESCRVSEGIWGIRCQAGLPCGGDCVG